MEIIFHRRNTIKELISTPNIYGVEIDIRTFSGKLIVSHDPYLETIELEEWLAFYKHGILIANSKEEGLEQKILELFAKYKIENFFFLDQSFPFLIKTIKNGEKRCAIRLSEYESIKTVLSLKGLLNWIWVDYFTKFPINKSEFELLKENGFKICIVSPELQGYGKKEVSLLKEFLKKNDIRIDAVCTKKPELWEI